MHGPMGVHAWICLRLFCYGFGSALHVWWDLYFCVIATSNGGADHDHNYTIQVCIRTHRFTHTCT